MPPYRHSRPADLLRGVYSYLDGASVARCEMVCKAMKDAGKSPVTWRNLVLSEFVRASSQRCVARRVPVYRSLPARVCGAAMV